MGAVGGERFAHPRTSLFSYRFWMREFEGVRREFGGDIPRRLGGTRLTASVVYLGACAGVRNHRSNRLRLPVSVCGPFEIGSEGFIFWL
jgi:hypothetical protein